MNYQLDKINVMDRHKIAVAYRKLLDVFAEDYVRRNRYKSLEIVLIRRGGGKK